MIPVKIDIFSEYDAAGTVRGLLFAGVVGVDTVVISGSCRGGVTVLTGLMGLMGMWKGNDGSMKRD